MKHSTYFEGKVQSLEIKTDKGRATVGVIEPGKYSFSTASQETMEIVSGALKYKLKDGGWKEVKKSENFIVPAGQVFDVEAPQDTAYICYYK
ncbi:MAG: pyrimidine/purine nucleoside phosphorylase [Candidatus Goldiibacteriota bacterium]